MPLTLLIASDNGGSREKLAEHLTAHPASEKCRVLFADDGASAMDRIGRETVDCLIADLIMPEMDGIALCRRIKGRDTLKHIPVILFSDVLTRPADQDRALEAGADRFIARGLDSEELLAAVSSLAEDLKNGRYVPRPPQAEGPAEGLSLKRYRPELLHHLEKRIHELESAPSMGHQTETRIQEQGKKLAEDALRESEEKFRSIAETSRDVIFQVTADGIFTYVSPSGEQVFGYSQDAFIGKQILDFPAAFDLDRAAKAFASAVAGNRINLFEFQGLRKDGSLVPLEVSAVPIIRDGQIVKVQGIARDVSKRKNAEKRQQELEDQVRQAQKMEAIGTLAGGIAHDFNNILASIIGYTELSVDETQPDTRLCKNLEEVLKGGYRARDLVRQILTFSRKTEADKKPVQIKLMVKEAVKLMRSTLPANIRIEENIESDGLVLCHPTHIHQIIMNLSTNAAHAMDPAGGTLHIDLYDRRLDADSATGFHDMKAGDYIDLRLSDTGMGMAENIIPQVFDPYFTTKEKGTGTGLGLSVVHGIVNALGGTITVSSEAGKGSTFRVLLPCLASGEAGQEQTIQTPVPGGTERILAIDDDPPVADMIKQMLTQLGYRVTARSSSLEALALFRSGPDGFDLVLTDMMMPQMTGTNLAGEIKRLRPDIPVVLCTGYSEKVDENTASAHGIAAYALKPLVKQQLAVLLRRVLDNKF